MPKVNHEILVWARETAGLQLDEARKKLQLSPESLKAYEAGEKEPSYPLLARMSKKYRRPMLVFYLKSPPRKSKRGEDFRTSPTGKKEGLADESRRNEANLDALMRDIHVRQSMVRSLLEDEESPELDFVGSATIGDGRDELVERITREIGFQREKYRGQRNYGEAFRYLRECVEKAGVFTILKGDLGSHHSEIRPEVFRGYVISDRIAPFIVINSYDAPPARSFTALHELVHLWLGESGVSGHYASYAYDKVEIEKFCNAVAGEILLPSAILPPLQNKVGSTQQLEEVKDLISGFAKKEMLSKSMVAYKLSLANTITRDKWRDLDEQFHSERSEQRQKEREERSKSGEVPKIPLYNRVVSSIGKPLLNLVKSSVGEGALTYTKAGKILGVSPMRVGSLVRN